MLNISISAFETGFHACLLFPDEVLKEEVELDLPDNAIDGSARALVSVLGNQITSLAWVLSRP